MYPYIITTLNPKLTYLFLYIYPNLSQTIIHEQEEMTLYNPSSYA